MNYMALNMPGALPAFKPLPKSRFHHLPASFSKLLFILYKVPLYIRHSSTLAYTVNKCTPALGLRFTGLP